MPLDFPGAAARLRRILPVALSAVAFAAPAGAHAADSLGAGGVVVSGSALTVGVSGAANQAGKLSARFSGVGSPLFWGTNTTNMNDTTSAVFALNTPSGLYSAQDAASQDNQPFTPLSAPVMSGTGTAGDPYVVTSQFRATASIDITQTVTHVSGTTRVTGTWAIHNGSASTTAMQAFEGADMYVNQNDNGTGTGSGSQPNRQIGSVASDGTIGYLVEQGGAPWTHYFSGANSPFYMATGDSTFGSFPDTIDPTLQDSGMGVEWDFNLGPGATKTVSVQWYFTPPAAPQAPTVTNVPTGTVNATVAQPSFAAAAGDTQVISYECSVDGGTFTACTSPTSLSGLADGVHTYDVRAVNSAGIPGPATTKTWTVDTTPPGAPTLGGAPTGTVATDGASITLSGDNGTTFRCSVDGGSYVGCTSPLVLTGLADGNHTVSVKQVDAANNVGTLVATASWAVDTSVPAAVDVDEPQDTTATSTDVAFDITPGMTAECSLDGAAFQACTSPLTVSGLSVGSHSLKVRMVNSAGTPGAEKTVTWVVSAPAVTPPTADPTPSASTPAKTATAAPAPTATIVPQACVSRRSVTVHWAMPGKAKATSFKVLVDGKVVKTLSGKARAFKLSLAGRGVEQVKVQVKARAAGGRSFATTRVYKTCAAKAGKAVLPTVVLKAVKG